MSTKRKRHNAHFKFQVALEAARGTKTVNQLASAYNLHPTQISQWKRQLLDIGPEIFNTAKLHQQRDHTAREAALFEQIGRLKMELEWLKKKLDDPLAVKRTMIEPTHPTLSMRRQCQLLGLNRVSLYRAPAQESPFNLRLMRLIDEQYTKTPFYGYPKMTFHVRALGYHVNEKRVARLMQVMGLQAVRPRVRTSRPNPDQRIYPYLLRGLDITQPNQVWCADIWDVPMPRGFMYLVAIMDWFSRYVLAWQLSNTLDVLFCGAVLRAALPFEQPAIFNTDQGAQFTARSFTAAVEAAGIRVRMDGRGRVMDNMFIERLWRTVKYEDIYLKEYRTVAELEIGLDTYFTFYNTARPHQGLDERVPAAVHFGG